MDRERRTGEKPVPDNLDEILKDTQKHTLRSMERFGWELIFVRRPLFQEPVAVLLNSAGEKVGILEEDGRLNMEAGIVLRD